MSKTILAYFDSRCETSTGFSCVGSWGKDEHDKVLFTKQETVKLVTPSKAQYLALFCTIAELIKALGEDWPKVTIHSNSKLLITQVNGIWKPSKPETVELNNKAVGLKIKYGFAMHWMSGKNNAIATALTQQEPQKPRYLLSNGLFRPKH